MEKKTGSKLKIPLLKDINYLERVESCRKSYTHYFGNSNCEVYSAPGRTEVCGNHTDHQNGKVLAAAVNLDIIGVCGKTDNNLITIYSEGYGKFQVDLNNIELNAKEFGTSQSIVKGVAKAFSNRNLKIGGFNCYVNSKVPGGAGLSSSAAFEVLMVHIFWGLYNKNYLSDINEKSRRLNDNVISPIEIAKICHWVENTYFGKPCGIMDQMACSLGGLIYMDLQSPDNPLIKKLDVDLENYGYGLFITNTGSSHEDLTHEYSDIREEMNKIAGFYSKDNLREVPFENLKKDFDKLRFQFGDRAVLRAWHFYLEMERVEKALSTLEINDFSGFIKLINESGDSSYKYLQNIYPANNSTHQELAVALAVSEKLLDKRGACRVHGGGFAGTIAAYVPLDLEQEYLNTIESLFGKDKCYKVSFRSAGGIRLDR